MTPRVVVSGTGRAGTTFLMRLLTAAGADTGYEPDGAGWYADARPLPGRAPGPGSGSAVGGLERHPRADWTPEMLASLPRVVKDPALCHALAPLLDSGKFSAEAVLCPVRDLRTAAASRLRRGLVWIPDPAEPDAPRAPPADRPALLDAQEEALALALGRLSGTCASRRVPLVLIPFETLTEDPGDLLGLLLSAAPDLLPEWDLAGFRRLHRALSAERP